MSYCTQCEKQVAYIHLVDGVAVCPDCLDKEIDSEDGNT
jgi:hypothetical protein